MSDESSKFNRDRVNSFLDVGRLDVLCQIFAWGTPNRSDSIPLDKYLESLPADSKANFPRLTKSHKYFSDIDINTFHCYTSCTKFDISLLYKAIKVACESVAECNDDAWITPSNRMEYFITAIKNERNDSMHGPREITAKEFLNTAVRLRKLFEDALTAAKLMYEKSDSELDCKIKNVGVKLDKLMLEVLGERDLLNYSTDPLRQDLIEETNKVLKKHFLNSLNIDPMFFLTTGTTLHLDFQKVFTEITVKGEGGFLRYQNLVQSLRSGSGSSQQPQALLVKGIAGSGKTTFVTLVINEWLKDAKNRIITGLDYYDLLLRVQCRGRNITSFNCFLENEVPDVFLKFRDLILPLIKKCKVLILMDGLDESNEDSEKLIDDILHQMKTINGCTLLFTSRSEGVTRIISKIPQGYQVSCIELIGISETYRADFVHRYHKEIQLQINNTQNTGKLEENVQNTEELVENVQQVLKKEHFRLPLNMVFLTWVYIHDPSAITSTTTQTQLYHNTYQLQLQKLLNRLEHHPTTRDTDPQILKTHIIQAMATVQYESLLALWHSQVTFEDEAIDRIKAFCRKQNIPPDQLLSAFLTLKTNRTYLGIINQYSPPHTGLQEFYAAKFITQHKLKNWSVSIRSVLKEHLGMIDKKLWRLQNMLCHVVGLLHLSSNTVLQTVTEEVVDILFESGMNIREQWLDLVEDTRRNPVVLRQVAPYFEASISERDMLEQLEIMLKDQEEEQETQEEERKKKEYQEDDGEEKEERTGQADKEDINDEERDKQVKSKDVEKREKEIEKEKKKYEWNLVKEKKDENYEGKKRKTKAIKEMCSVRNKSISPIPKVMTPVLISDSNIESLIALLPFLHSCTVRIEFEKDQGLLIKKLMNAMNTHMCISVTRMPHFKNPDQTDTSDHLLKLVFPRSQLVGFVGNLREIDLLPPTLETVSLALTDDEHAVSILKALQSHSLPYLRDLRIHVPVDKVKYSSLIHVLHNEKNENVKTFLFLSGVNDQLIEEACQLVKALQCPNGYEAITFPQASTPYRGWRKLLEGLAEAGIKVHGRILVTDNNETKEIYDDLKTLARSKLACEFVKAADEDLWLY